MAHVAMVIKAESVEKLNLTIFQELWIIHETAIFLAFSIYFGSPTTLNISVQNFIQIAVRVSLMY